MPPVSRFEAFAAWLHEFEQTVPVLVTTVRTLLGGVRDIVKEIVLLTLTLYGFVRLVSLALSGAP